MKAGQTLNITATISGSPQPSEQWFYNETELTPSNKITLDYKTGVATLTIKDTTRQQTGKFKLVAENSVGNASAEFNVTVKGMIKYVSL